MSTPTVVDLCQRPLEELASEARDVICAYFVSLAYLGGVDPRRAASELTEALCAWLPDGEEWTPMATLIADELAQRAYGEAA